MKRMLMGVAIGAGAMYLLDPNHGAERRRKLLGFYDENKDTIQDYAQTAAQTAVVVGQTAASTASTVADKAGELTGKTSTNGSANASSGNVDSLLEKRTAKGGTTSTSTDPAPGMGGSLST